MRDHSSDQPTTGQRRRRREQERLQVLTGESQPPALGPTTASVSSDAALPVTAPASAGPAAPRPLTRRELRARAAQPPARTGTPRVGFVPEPPPGVAATVPEPETGSPVGAGSAGDVRGTAGTSEGAYRWWHLAVLAVVAFVLGMLVVRVVTDPGDGDAGTPRPDAAPTTAQPSTAEPSTADTSTERPSSSTDPTGE